MTTLTAEVHEISMATPKRATIHHVGAFLGDVCQNLNRYMDAAQKVHVPENKPEQSTRRSPSDR